MRILVVGINYAPDMIGVAKYNTELCEALASFGHEVRMITAPPYYPEWCIPKPFRGFRYNHELTNGVFVTRSPIYVPSDPTGGKRLLHHASFALTSAWPVLSASLRKRPDVVFSVAPSLISAAFASWIGRRTGALTWLHLQDFEVDAAFDLGLLKGNRLRQPMIAIERNILRSFDRVSTISPQMLSLLEGKGVDGTKTFQLRNWTDTAQILPSNRNTSFRKALQLDESRFVGLYSGTMSNKQGLELAIEAARILEPIDPRIYFVLCGDGPHRAVLERLATGLTNVRFIGLQPNDKFAELLRSADFHLIPQRAEAADLVLPSKLGGILATGCPVIVMADQGTGLAAEVSGAGLIVPPGDVGALAAAVRKLSDDSDLYRSLGAHARRIAILRWDKTSVLAELEQTILTLIEQRKAQRTLGNPIVGIDSSKSKDAVRLKMHHHT